MNTKTTLLTLFVLGLALALSPRVQADGRGGGGNGVPGGGFAGGGSDPLPSPSGGGRDEGHDTGGSKNAGPAAPSGGESARERAAREDSRNETFDAASESHLGELDSRVEEDARFDFMNDTVEGILDDFYFA